MLLCKNLIQLPSLQEATVLTGRRGLENVIRWTYTAEDMDFAKWVRGGELLIIGKIACQPDFDLGRVIRTAVQKQMAGAVFLFGGAYVKSVSPAVIDYAKDHNFPLFSIPWNVPLVDVMEEIGRAASQWDSGNDSRDPLTEILFGSLPQKAQQDLWREIHYPAEMPQCLAVLVFQRMPLQDKVRDTLPQEYRDLCDAWLTKRQIPHAVTLHYGHILILFARKNADGQTVLDELTEAVRESGSQAVFHIGAALAEHAYSLGPVYEKAQIARRIAYSYDQQKAYVFRPTGIREFILGVSNHEEFLAYSALVLEKLVNYDRKNNKELVETLKTYLDAGGSLQRTAERLYIHRNTLNYRLKRIREITGADINEPFTRMAFEFAFVIHQLH